MIRGIRLKCKGTPAILLCLSVSLLYSNKALGGEVASMPSMPGHWIVTSDFLVPAEQVESMSGKLGAGLSSVRNTVYDVNGKRVQVNVIITPDTMNAEKLMIKLESMKAKEALLRKGRIIYEFVGKNDVLPLIAEGRNHLDSQ